MATKRGSTIHLVVAIQEWVVAVQITRSTPVSILLWRIGGRGKKKGNQEHMMIIKELLAQAVDLAEMET